MDDPQRNRWFVAEVLPHDALLRSFLRGRFPDVRPADIDDLVQECYARLWRARTTGPIVSPRAFLLVTARNFALNHLRHLGYERGEPLPESEAPGVRQEEGGFEAAARSEEVEVLIQAIAALPERCRQILTLRKIYGWSQREIAQRLGISENTVEKQAVIGLRKCVAFFERQGHLPRR